LDYNVHRIFINLENNRKLLRTILIFTGLLFIANLLTPQYKTNIPGTTYQSVPHFDGGHVGRRTAGKPF
jgi:hypothetical protein